MLVLEIAALRRQHPSRLSHHTDTPWRRSGRAACRGIPINPSAGCCTQDTPLVETQSAQQPWSQSPLHLSRATCCSQSSGCQRGHPAASVHLGTYSEISTTNIQQLNKTTDTPCAMQKVFVLLVCFQMTLAEPRQGDRLQKGTPHHHEHKVPGGKKGLWHQSDLQVLGKNLRMWRNGQGKGRWGREQGTLRISGHIAPQETSVKKSAPMFIVILSSTEHVALQPWTPSHQPLQEGAWKKEAIRINLSLRFNLSACRKGRISNASFPSP